MVQRTNLLFILSDNHNRDLLGCYGHPQVRTPHLDRLSAAGTRFMNAYTASPLCCPARAALATGRFPHQSGYWDNAIAYDGRIPSWMRRLRDAGHEVVSVGKLHFRSADDDNGFSQELIPMHILDGRGAVQNLLRGYDAELSGKHAKRWELYLEKSGVGESHYVQYDREITEQATRWLRECGAATDGWVLFVSYASPHPPFIIPQRLLDLYPADQITLPPHVSPHRRAAHPSIAYHREKFGAPDATDVGTLQRMIAAYYGLITHVDEQVGQLLDCLGKTGLACDTRIIYSSDHGEMRGAHGLLGKAILYEDAVAVPLIFSGPGIPGGRVVRQIVSHTDLYPTLLESFGVPPERAEDDLRGTSLWPALTGRETERAGFAEYHANFSKSGAFMVRLGNLKLIHHVDMPPQLFDLARDPHEMNDLAWSDEGHEAIPKLEALLGQICSPGEVDARAKADQRRRGELFGGREQIAKARFITFSPPPGRDGDAIGAFSDSSA